MGILTTRAGDKAGREVSDTRVPQLPPRLVADLAITHTVLVFTVTQNARVLGLGKFLTKISNKGLRDQVVCFGIQVPVSHSCQGNTWICESEVKARVRTSESYYLRQGRESARETCVWSPPQTAGVGGHQ